MNLNKKREQEYFLMSLASLLLKRPFSWLSLLAPPLLHILGLRFLHLLLTSAVLFFSSFFFPFSLPSSIQLSKHDPEQGQDDVAIEDITAKSEVNLETTTINEEDDEDGAISDDESLIELSLPSGHYLGSHQNSNKNHLIINNKVQDFRVFDLFNDFIEEDNLIEIDISIGSIKYSRFEIKA